MSSHCSDRTTLDAIEASTKPVLVTHANCRALVPGSARCRTDEAIRKLAAKGGVLGVTMVRVFRELRRLGDHRERLGSHRSCGEALAGIEHHGLSAWRLSIWTAGEIRSRRKNDLDGIHYAHKIFGLTEDLVRRKLRSPAEILNLFWAEISNAHCPKSGPRKGLRYNRPTMAVHEIPKNSFRMACAARDGNGTHRGSPPEIASQLRDIGTQRMRAGNG